jgi:uncharacterized protein
MAKDFDPHRLDVRRFAEEGGEIGASDPLHRFARLAAEAQEPDAARKVRWRARGELRNPGHHHPQIWVHLDADAQMPLVCQRCLHPVDVPLQVQRSFRFVADEATAAAEDDESEEDLLALSRSFDLLELVEDELLMELPVAPRHDLCPEAVKMSAVDADFEAAAAEKENPFAVLGRLKSGK